MAKKYLIDEIGSITAGTNLDGMKLIVETKRLTFPRVNSGNHYYQIKKVDNDYAVYPLHLNADNTDYELAEEPVILTVDDTVFFYVHRDLAPYMDKKFQERTIEAGDIKEAFVLAAFKAYAQSKYSMGNYTILLVDDVSVEEATAPAPATPAPATPAPATPAPAPAPAAGGTNAGTGTGTTTPSAPAAGGTTAPTTGTNGK